MKKKSKSPDYNGVPSLGQPVSLSSLICTYNQDPDGNDTEEQSLVLSTEDSGAGTYFLMQTERWAFDEPEDLINIIHDFVKRAK